MLFAVALAVVLPQAAFAGTRGLAEARADAGVTPVQKVLQMLDSMLAKGKRAKHEEEEEFAKFHEWCDGVQAEKTRSIEEASEQIAQLSADAAKAESDAEVLAREIAELEAAIARAEEEAATATALRKKENADYEAQHADFSESIDAIARAVQVLKARTADIPQSLVQVRSLPLLPQHAKAAITAYLEMGSGNTGGDLGVPEANAYEFQSGGVIAILEKLALKFKDQRLALQKAEMSAKANYEMLMQQLEDNLKADKATATQKTAAKAGRLEDAASAKAEKEITEKAKAEDENTLSDTLSECHARSEEYEKNQVLRSEEVKAIEKAMDILSSAAVAGHAETYLPGASLSQAHATMFTQLLAATGREGSEGPQGRAAAYLQARAKQLGSRYLAVMASHAAEDPFAKVKKMIKDLITRLMEEANEEADQHAYCTTELATNKQTRENKASEAEELAAQAEQLAAEAAQLEEEIQQLSDAMAEIEGERAARTTLRKEEKAANMKTISDAKEAQVAVEQAIQVLRSFYAKAADAAVLLQSAANYASGLHTQAPYKGLQDETTGVMGMLDVILSDFARLETETSAAEEQAVVAYEKFMAETTEDLQVKRTTKEHKESKKQRTEEALRSTKKELQLTQEELTRALDYYDKLKAECVDHSLSYSERKKSREEEIQSLQEALNILNGEDLA